MKSCCSLVKSLVNRGGYLHKDQVDEYLCIVCIIICLSADPK